VPTEPGVHLELGDLYFGPLGDPGRARAHYNAFLRYAPGHARAAEIRERLSGVAHGESAPPPTAARTGGGGG